MHVGVVILPEHSWPQARDIWKEVEDLGFDHAWTYDHLAWRSLSRKPWYSAVPTLAAAAVTTRTIGLGTLVTSPNFRHPVLLAKDAMSLDDLSGGRITLGIGAGSADADEHVVGAEVLAPVQRAERFGEFVSALDRLLCEPVTDVDGRYYTINEAPVIPGCVQRPRVPFAIAAAGPKGIRLAARHAQIWVTNGDPRRVRELPEPELLTLIGDQLALLRRECEALGRDPSDVRAMVNGSVVGEGPVASLDAFVDFASRCAELGFTDLTVHYPRTEGIFAGDRVDFARIMAEALPVVRDIRPRSRATQSQSAREDREIT